MNLQQLLELISSAEYASVSVEDAREHLELLRAQFDARRNDPSDEDAEVLRAVADAFDAVKAHVGKIEADAAARQSEADELASKIFAEDAEGDVEGESDASADTEWEADAPAEGEGDAPAEGVEGADVAEQGRLAASSRRFDHIPLAKRIETEVPAAAPDAPTPVGLTLIQASSTSGGVAQGDLIPSESYGTVMVAAREELRRAGSSPSGELRSKSIGTVVLPVGDREVVAEGRGTIESDSMLLASAFNKAAEADKAEFDAILQASGGACAPAETDYSFRLLSDFAGCMAGSLPMIRTRRPIQYNQDILLDLSTISAAPFAAGIGVTTEAQDASGATYPKPCVQIDCPPPPTPCELQAVHSCIEVGYWIANNYPEYLDLWRRQVQIAFAFTRDQEIMDTIITAAGAPITAGGTGFGSNRELLPAIRTLITRAGINGGQSDGWTVWVPQHAKVQLANDLLRTMFGITNADPLPYSVDQGLALLARDNGIMVKEYCVDARAPFETFVAAPVKGGPLALLPNQTRIIIQKNDSVFMQTQGEISLSLRELGIRNNNYGEFYEVFESTCVRNPKGLFILDVTHCDNGNGGGSVDYVCA